MAAEDVSEDLAALEARPPVLVLGVPITDLTMTEAVGLVGGLVRDGRRHRRTHQIATVNVDFLAHAVDTTDVRSILQGSDLCLADGMPVVWASRILGMGVRERVAGADLLPELVRASASEGWHVHVFGSSPSVAERAVSILEQRYPGCCVSVDAGGRVPDSGDVDDDTLASIAARRADILCVALGHPKQERFIARYRERIGAPVQIGVGGSLDMLVGDRRRAPVWAQRTGTEWIVRAAQEPRRLGGRYARDIRVVAPRILTSIVSDRRRGLRGLGVESDGRSVTVSVRPERHVPTLQDWTDAVGLIRRGAILRVDTRGAASLTNAAASWLVGVLRVASRYEAEVQWTGPRSLAEDLCGAAASVGSPEPMADHR